MTTVTPWEVEGKIDYERLIKEFGVEKITNDLLEKIKDFVGELHPLLKRQIFYAHRDLNLILKDYEEGKGFFLYTGRAPSKSSMHLGHIIPFILTKWLQEKFDVNVYIQIPDEEKYLAKKVDSLEDVEKFVDLDILNIIAIGFDPNKTFVFKDSEYIRNMYKLAVRVAKNINLSTAKAVFGFLGETSIGLIFYPALQIVPSFFENKRCLIPMGIDQDPYFRLQRDIAEKLGFYKTACLHSKFIWGLEGPESKMSASKPETCINLLGNPEEESKKVMNAFTGGQPTAKEQKEKGGNPSICSVYHWFYILLESDDKKIKELYEDCKTGNIICGECKQKLKCKLKEFLENHQKNIEKAKKIKNKFLYDGKLAKEMWKKEYK